MTKPLSFYATLLLASQAYAQIGIGTYAPHESSIVDLTSTNQGFLPPRLTIIERNKIADPVNGLMIYCKNCCTTGTLSYFDVEWNNIPDCSLTDNDDDGIANNIDIDDDNDGIIDRVENCVQASPKAYYNTASKEFGYLDIESNSETFICNTTKLYGDLGIDTFGNVYGVTFTNPSELYQIDINNCNETLIANVNFNSGNALSFLPDNSLLIGGASSAIVRKATSLSPYNATIWHDFTADGASNPGGDFVIVNNKLYISMYMGSTIDETHLFEVTYDDNYNYVSHVNLGSLGRRSWGFSVVREELYSFYADSIFKVSIESPPVLTLVHRSTSNSFYGGTSVDESFGYCVSGNNDVDGDGILNRYDLDSDGDGCSDALESGNTTLTTSNYSFTLENVGANGLNNSIENNDSPAAVSNNTTSETKPFDSTCP